MRSRANRPDNRSGNHRMESSVTDFQFRMIQSLLAEFSADELLNSGVVHPRTMEQYLAYR